jgi:ribosome biogenesis protein Tsr3
MSAGGTKVISKEDIEIIRTHGLLVIDCSWAKIEQIETNYENQRLCKPFSND